jgi:hypothetical protein
MSYTHVVVDGVLAKRQAAAMQEFDYAAFNERQAMLADQHDHYAEIRHTRETTERARKERKVVRLNKQYAKLMDAWAAEKTFETFCAIEDLEETLVKLLG